MDTEKTPLHAAYVYTCPNCDQMYAIDASALLWTSRICYVCQHKIQFQASLTQDEVDCLYDEDLTIPGDDEEP